MERDYVLPIGEIRWERDENNGVFNFHQEDPVSGITTDFQKNIYFFDEKKTDLHPNGVRKTLNYNHISKRFDLVIHSPENDLEHSTLTLIEDQGKVFSGNYQIYKSGIIFSAAYTDNRLAGLFVVRNDGFKPEFLRIYLDSKDPSLHFGFEYEEFENGEVVPKVVPINRDNANDSIDFLYDDMHLYSNNLGGYFEIDSPLYFIERLRFNFPPNLPVKELGDRLSKPDDVEWPNIIDTLPFGVQVVLKSS